MEEDGLGGLWLLGPEEAFGLDPASQREPGPEERRPWGRPVQAGGRRGWLGSDSGATTFQDVRLLAAGKAPQRASEVERDLDKADGMIRLLFNDVQTLKDGRHPQGEQMYRRWAVPLSGLRGRVGQPSPADRPAARTARRVYRLHERLVAIRTEYNLRLRGAARHPELEDSSLRYLQELLAWVEENQRRVDGAEWGVDLPSVEAQLGSHRGLHQSIEEFRAKIERARADEVSGHLWGGQRAGARSWHGTLTSPHRPQGQLSPATRGAYRDCLGRLDLQYAKLLVSGGLAGGGGGGGGGAAADTAPRLPTELLQGPPPVPGEPAWLCGGCHQGADVAEREGGRGGGL